ncbi:MAG: hypothetical protein M3313_16640 [Actinomycetota bacterium]|nr:hypothetical protein [Actinomycetota bacterium]
MSVSRTRRIDHPSVPGCGLEGIAGGEHCAASGTGEQVQILGGSGDEALRDQRRATGQEETVAFGEREERRGYGDLKCTQSGGFHYGVRLGVRR